MKKRILSLFLAVVMVLGLLPVGALATGTEDETVYISVSNDGQYVSDKNGSPMAYVPVAMSALADIDLAKYGLSAYNYNDQITALHLYIYTHETIMGLDWDDARVSGGAGSIFFEGGLFGFTDCNLQYYCNGEYPAVGGWGVTADQLVLEAGDFLDIAGYTSWNFYSDSAAGFHYFMDGNNITHEYEAAETEALTVKLGRSGGSMGGETTLTTVPNYTVKYGSVLGTADGTVTTDKDGQAQVTFPEAGTYYLWADGGYGAEYPLEIVSSPAYAKVTVEAAEEPEPEPVTYTVTLPGGEGYTVSSESDSTVTEGGSYSFTVTIADGYEASESFAVKANDVKLTAVEDVYTIENITADQTVTVEGVAVVKEPGPLSALKFTSGSGASAAVYTMTPAFDPALREYELVVPDAATSVFAWATLSEGITGTIQVKYTNTSNAAKSVTLTSGKTTGTSLSSVVKSALTGNTLEVTVGGETAYTVNIVRQATLSSIVLKEVTGETTNDLTLSPKFDYKTTEYTADASHTATKLEVTPKVKSTGATVTIDGVAAASGSGNEVSIAWKDDLTADYTITVSAENAVSSTYTVTLSQLAAKIEIETPPSKTVYDVGEKFDASGMTLKATYSDGSSEIIGKDAYTYEPAGTLAQSTTGISVSFDGHTVTQLITMNKVFDGQGTQADPYLIKTQADLVKLSELVDAGASFSGEYLRMVNDITLPEEWVPLGTSTTKPFSGYFDGNGKLLTVPEGGLPLIGYPAGAALSNLNIYGSKIAGYGVVQNYAVHTGNTTPIIIDGVTLKSGTQTLQSGFIGGYASGTNQVVIKNCTVESGVVIGYDKNQSSIGSFGGDYNGTIENCVSYATVYGVDFVGGIVGGKGQTMGDFLVKNSQFHGAVIATGNYVGGIVGHGYTGAGFGIASAPNTPIVTIQTCVCDGSVTGADYVGGILGAESGVAQCWDNGVGYIQKNVFSGTITASNDANYVGGVIGYIRSLNKYTVIEENQYSGTCGAAKGIGGVEFVDTNCATHETESGATYLNTETSTADCPKINSCSWRKAHNRTDDPLGVDAGKLCAVISAEPVTYTVTLPVREGYTVTTADGSESPVTEGGSYSFTVTITDGYEAGENFAVKANDTKLTAVEGVYTIENITADQTITVEGIVSVDEAAAAAVEEKIADIGEVTLASEKAIKAAREAYDALTATQQSRVENIQVLEAAEKRLAALQAAAADEAAANAVEKKISAIGAVTLASEEAIQAARAAYDALTDDQKELVKNYNELTDAEAKYAELKAQADKAEADQAAADSVMQLIADIGTVSLGSKAAITEARSAYDALTDDQKALVKNLGVLEAAEEALEELKEAAANEAAAAAVEEKIADIGEVTLASEKAIKAAREAYNALTATQQSRVENIQVLEAAEKRLAALQAAAADEAAANAVEKKISAIGAVTLASEEAIQAARAAYDALTDDQKELVKNYNELTDAEAKYAELKAQADKAEADQAAADSVMQLIADIGTVSLGSKDAIDTARGAYDALTDDQKALVKNLGVLEAAEETFEELKKPALTWQEVMAMTQTYLTEQAEKKAPIVGSTSGEWLVLGLARAGVSAEEDFFQAYYENVLAEEIDANGRLDANRSTENSRVILALTALGKDVAHVGGHNLLQGLSDQDFVKKQGINGPVWALIALDSHDYEIPANTDSSKQVTRQWLVDYILDNQLPDGGWKIQGQTPDDMTPMAVQALASYYNSDSRVKAAVDKALAIMDGMVETTTSPETLSQIIVARSALGLDSEAAVAKLAALAQEDGSFKKGPSDNKANQMSTEQAFYGLVAYDRFRSGKTALYDMTDVVIEKVEDEPQEEPVPVTGIALNKTALTLEVGKTELLTATVTPGNAADKTVTWTSSNPGVAAVSAQGSVTAVAEGTTSISAKAGDVTAVCVVTVTAQEVGLDFGLTESQIKGYVTVSFEDFGKRVSGESMDAIYKQPLGTIIPATQVPYTRNDTIASVTLRLLDAMDYTSSYQGTMTNGFYLESIGGFTHKGTYYPSFGEFDAGVGSGWMITWNNWFIDQGASEFTVKNGDVIRWQYTCQLGADIGEDMSDEVYGVKALIDAIGTVTKDSGPAIQAARAAYDKLTNPQKALVTNYNKLTAAEKAYADLLAQEEIPDETAHPFSDTTGHWAEEAITYVYEKGLMTGTKADRFSPETELSRAMLVTILYRMAGEPAVTADNTFSDVTDGTWYTNAVIWASQNGIVNGVGEDLFAPNNDITREQMAAMLLRYSDYKDYDTAQRNDLSGYTDADSISAWALAALQWANGEGLITGRTAHQLAPQGDTTRAETATILMRYLETIA